MSVKSEIIHNHNIIDMNYKKKEEIDKNKFKIIKEECSNIVTDEDLYFKSSDKNKESLKSCVPPTSNSILFAIYTPSEKTLWVSIDGSDKSCLYEYDFNTSGPINVTIIPDKNNIPLTVIKIW